MYSNKIAGVVAGAVALLLLSAPSYADLTKCATLIDGENAKMQAAMIKHFQKCIDGYHKDLAKVPKTGPFTAAAKVCDKELGKGIGSGGDIDKEVTTKLIAGFTKNTCTESDLLALGHLSHKLYTDNWARLQGVSAFHSAYEQALAGSRDFIQGLIDMGKSASPGCPNCVKINHPLCNEMSSVLASSSQAVVLVSVLNLTVPLSGTTVLKICDNTVSGLVSGGILPNIPASTFYVLGGPGKLLDPAPVGNGGTALATACTRTIAAEGIIQCGSAQRISYVTCQDHTPSTTNADGASASGGCTGQDSCARTKKNSEQSVVDPKDGPPIAASDTLIGGACIKTVSTAGVAGDGFVNLTSQIGLHRLVTNDNCQNPATLDDAGLPATTSLTTGTAAAKVLNQDSEGGTPSTNELDSDVVTGSIFNCATLNAGQTKGTHLVGAFPAINTLQLSGGGDFLDSVTTFELDVAP
ncbi:MAG TPA: hypothetical protein VMW56_02775 [Candidatus Margulisiibacteriota bacterium]|nr:hypothetical protein [Candidatus Margulisiibacteriota bacterium]